MPASVERCVQKLVAQGKPKDQAWAICTAAYKKALAKKGKRA